MDAWYTRAGSLSVSAAPAQDEAWDDGVAEARRLGVGDRYMPMTAEAVAARVRNAGAVFVGPYSPVSLGDYCAGSNHVLPTGGCARHSGGLSVHTFLRPMQVIAYDEAALQEVAAHVVTLARVEDLPAHAEAVTVRFSGR